jgi:hypothetical protein
MSKIQQGLHFVKEAVNHSPAVLCAGLALGAGLGAGGGALVAHHAVDQVPVQSTTQTWQAPVMHDVTLGHEPADQYIPCYGFCGGYTDGAADQAVVRSNPVLDQNGQPEMHSVTKTFSGHGTYTVKEQTKDIDTLSMHGYSVSVWPVYTQVLDHYDTTYVPTYSEECTSVYQPDGSTSQDCTEVQTGTQTIETPVYRSELIGENIDYSPNLSSHTDGTYTEPQVSFDSGVPVGAIIAEGAAVGLAAGAAAGIGFSALLERRRRQQPDQPVPDPEPVPGPDLPGPDPQPDPGPEQPPAVEPGHPLLTGDQYHEHGWAGGARVGHEHYWGDEWHEHDAHDATASTDQIYFKKGTEPAGFDPADGTPGPNGTIVYDMQKYLQQGVPA